MRVARVFTGSDGRSQIEEGRLRWQGGARLRTSESLASSSVRFVELPAGYDSPLHNAPARQFVVFLSGRCELVCGSGARWQGGSGDVLLVEDVAGEGHGFRVVDGPLRALFVPVDESFAAASWLDLD